MTDTPATRPTQQILLEALVEQVSSHAFDQPPAAPPALDSAPLRSLLWCDVPNWTVAKITGQNVRQFLQGQVTCHLDHLSKNQALWGAHCNVKGRALANFILIETIDGIFIVTPSETFPQLQASLKKYGLFNQIAITPQSVHIIASYIPFNADTTQKGAVSDDSAAKPGHFETIAEEADSGLTVKLGERFFCHCIWRETPKGDPAAASSTFPPDRLAGSIHQKILPQEMPSALWALGLIEARLGFITEATAESFIPVELNMDIKGGIALDKGCYIGQEIIARLHYRGQAKQRLCAITLPAGSPQCAAGYALFEDCDQSNVGTIITATQTATGQGIALAVLRLSKLKREANASVSNLSLAGIKPPSAALMPLPERFTLLVTEDTLLASST